MVPEESSGRVFVAGFFVFFLPAQLLPLETNPLPFSL